MASGNDPRLESLFAGITARRDALIALTTDLIKIPTVNPPGACYREICGYLDARLKQIGFNTELLRATGALGDSKTYPRWNIVARREGQDSQQSPGPCIHFNAHIDVVPPGQGWQYDPFGATRKGDRIYGRGACDMKGGLASAIIAAEAFIECYPDYTGAIEISGTADEESGGFGGVAWLAEQGYFNPERVGHVIIPEPLNKDRICLGHRGVWWAEIETKGRIAHGSMPFLGDCAVRHMGAVLAEIEQTLIPALAKRHTAMPVVPTPARQSTLNINSIHGGLPESQQDATGFPSACVPDRCMITIDRRYLIEENPDAIKQEIENLLERIKQRRPDFSYEVRELFEVRPIMIDKSAPIAAATARAIEAVMDKKPQYVISPGTYDQKHIDRIGKLHNCIAYGPGILELAHQPDEWISIDDMTTSAKVMGHTLAQLLAPGA
ncbi:MAG: acetylornithine deacetylase/succinyl-diaminopimelate desuccinylase family protein [Pseudomonadota bacterium]